MQPQDTILFYFSGHGHYDEGINDTILCLEKTSKDNLAGTGLLITTVLAKITNSPAKQQLILLDACHSGGVASQLIDAILRVSKNNPSLNLYCITACDRHQQSFETPELEHGIFTYYLLEGLKGEGSQSLLKTDDLYSFVASQTQNYIDRTNEVWNLIHRYKPYPSFKPQRLVTGHGEFILGVSSNPAQDNRARGALVLDGCCPYQNIIDISQSLATQGGFAYQPYPSKSESLADSISALLTSSATTTALLYLQGKFETNSDGVWFVFADGIGVSRDWLAQQLKDSNVQQQIIILDCCQTSNIKTHVEALKQPDKSHCIVAFSSKDNWFALKFLEMIKAYVQDGLTATNLILHLQLVYQKQGIFDSQERYFYRSEKGILNVLLSREHHLQEIIIDRNYCPYKSLEAFTVQDKHFFFGRKSLIQETIDQLQEKNFLLLVGASGSGKS